MFRLANHIITSANQGGVDNLSNIFNFHFFPVLKFSNFQIFKFSNLKLKSTSRCSHWLIG